MRNNLIDFRKKLGMTQDEFGEMFNLNKQQVSFIENGKRKGSPEFWLEVQKKFNLTNSETIELMVVQNERA